MPNKTIRLTVKLDEHGDGLAAGRTCIGAVCQCVGPLLNDLCSADHFGLDCWWEISCPHPHCDGRVPLDTGHRCTQCGEICKSACSPWIADEDAVGETKSESLRTSSDNPQDEELTSTTTIKPRVFLSYRRSHSGEARALKMELNHLGYEVFFDLDRDSGLGIGPFQQQLEEVLSSVEVVIVMITEAPSGEKADVDRQENMEDGTTESVKGRFNMSSTETMKEYARLGWTDYCALEVERALAANKMIIPVYHGRHGASWIGQQLSHLRDLPGLASLRGLNAYDISDSLFKESVAVIDKHIQRGRER